MSLYTVLLYAFMSDIMTDSCHLMLKYLSGIRHPLTFNQVHKNTRDQVDSKMVFISLVMRGTCFCSEKQL